MNKLSELSINYASPDCIREIKNIRLLNVDWIIISYQDDILLNKLDQLKEIVLNYVDILVITEKL